MPPRTLHATVRVADMPQFKELVKAAQAVIDAPDRVSHYDPLLDQHWEAVEHLARTLRDLGFVTAAKGAA